MSYASITIAKELTMVDYRAVTEQLGEKPAEGLIAEAAGWNDTGLHVITVWDTKAQHDQFVAERLVPAFGAAGVRPGPLTFIDLEDALCTPVGETVKH